MKNEDKSKDEEDKMSIVGDKVYNDFLNDSPQEINEEVPDTLPDSTEKPPTEGSEKEGQLSVREAYQIYENCVDKAETLAQEMYESAKKSSRSHPQEKIVEPKDNLDIEYGIKGYEDATLVGTNSLRDIKTYKVPPAVKKVLNGETS